ncbi:monofunctional biosynthetic peptidoglycan transglycosylase [Blastococcus aurantiacus]|uniref:Monofunctional biosynthetic peptidoglycan transglycosylase n=1 Tax=Blastococcus aurantiacus TaxID=1550231 RepID=A0A1G7I1A9_9ACTN|nr:transglycosylase domain-containing protein [Blastococcus aurantiacus]SDF06522.1 monofunctional biosynthetic peptidoglycan transglycosylase [Blastococcus aurantiacus]
MGSYEPDRRATRRFRRPPAGPPPSARPPQADEPLRFDEYGRPVRDPRFDRPPPAGNDWYGAPPVDDRYGRPPSPQPPQPPLPPAPEPGRRGGRSGRPRRRKLLRRVAKVLAVLAVVQALVVLSLRWVDPPTTAFMSANPDGAIQQSVPVEHVSRTFLAAVIAHEDSALPTRAGAFEWGDLWERAQAHMAGEEDTSGSTIPQQVTKNLFLNQELSAVRKGVEALLSVEVAALIDDRRMLELYVNYAQFGPTIYGVCAASWYWFDVSPADLTQAQAVRIVGLLPSPGHVQRAPGGGMDFEVDDGLGWLSRSHVLNAEARVPAHLERLGTQPVEDVGIEGDASDEEPSGDDCSSPPDEVTELIDAEGTA